MRIQEMLAESVLSSKALVGRYLAGFDDASHTRQAPMLPNHVAWNLGHLALTMHRVAGMIDGGSIPAADFAPAGEARGDRFVTESVAFGSKPGDDRAGYPALARCVQVFESACERLATAARNASDVKLQEQVPWGQGQTPLWLLVVRMCFHNGMHTGQIADLRRAFGFRSIFS
jgi:hypothetical protein